MIERLGRFRAEGRFAHVVLMLAAASGGAQARPSGSELDERPAAVALWGGLESGAHWVGLELITVLDSKRILRGTDAPAEIQVAVWYPATKAGPKAVTHGDYLDLKAWDQAEMAETPENVAGFREKWKEDKLNLGVAEGHLELLAGMPSGASQDAPPAAGPFPVVGLIQGMGGSLEEPLILAEYLASNGYIVVSMPHPARIVPGAPDSALAQVELIPMLLEVARERTAAHADDLGLVAYSQTGACITLFQDRTHSAKALLSLDGWDGWSSGAQFVRENLTGSLDELDAPFAYLAEDPSVVKQYEGPSAWDHSLVRDLTARPGGFLLYFRDLRHVDFTSSALLEAHAPGYSFSTGWQMGVRTSDQVVQLEVHRYALRFLNTHVKGDTAARAALCADPSTHGLPSGSTVLGVSGLCGTPDREVVFGPGAHRKPADR